MIKLRKNGRKVVRDEVPKIAKVFSFFSDKKSFLLYLTRYTKNDIKYAKEWAIELYMIFFMGFSNYLLKFIHELSMTYYGLLSLSSSVHCLITL